MIHFTITPSAGKRLIAKSLAAHPSISNALNNGTVVITAGTTNGYIAEELLCLIGQLTDFKRAAFYRGVILPPQYKPQELSQLFKGDVVIVNGVWQKGKTISDVIDDLKEGDVIIKGVNCINLEQKKAGILIGHPKCGTIGIALPAVIGRRVKLILPAGLEKRTFENIDTIASILNVPGATGPRLFPVDGDIITELEAIKLLCGAEAHLVAAGGVLGAEGAVWLTALGNSDQIDKLKRIIDSIKNEPPFSAEDI